MKADYIHKDTLTSSDYVELNKNNELLMSYNQALLKENQKLNQKYLNAVADYETTMSELQELRKQLEEYKRLGFKHLNDKCNKLENQQKEFISYLENMLDDENDIFSVVRVKDVLSKYKSIIVGKE